MNVPRPLVVALMIVVPAVLRSLQVEWNIVPIGALALFCGAHFRNRGLALVIPIAAMLLGDALLGIVTHKPATYLFHPLFLVVYGCYAISALMGMGLRGYWDRLERVEHTSGEGALGHPSSPLVTRALPIAGATLAGSVLFYLATNFGDWLLFDTYAKTFRGLVECYLAALPFFRGTLTGDVVGAALLFGGDWLLQSRAFAVAESERF